MDKSQVKASNKYNKANTKQVIIRLSIKYDTDILKHLETVDNKAGYIKQLIRQDILNHS